VIYKILEARNEIRTLNSIREMQVLKIGQFNMAIARKKALTQKTNYNWQGLDVA